MNKGEKLSQEFLEAIVELENEGGERFDLADVAHRINIKDQDYMERRQLVAGMFKRLGFAKLGFTYDAMPPRGARVNRLYGPSSHLKNNGFIVAEKNGVFDDKHPKERWVFRLTQVGREKANHKQFSS